MRVRAIALMTLLASGCAHQAGSSDGQMLSGQWGGDQIALEIAADGSGQIEMSCASAAFAGPVKLDIGGHFLTAGQFTRGTGVAMINPPPPVPANISGRLDQGGVLWLDIALADSYPVRNARLRRGAAPNLLRCL